MQVTATRAVEAVAVGATAVALCYSVIEQLGLLSGADLLVIAMASAFIGMIVGSFCRSPSQFLTASWERIVFLMWTPIAVMLIIGLFALRIGFLMFKLSLKLIISAIVGIAYLLMPFDIIPDFILGLGQIDDLFLIVGLALWAFSAASMEGLRASITSKRPSVGFP